MEGEGNVVVKVIATKGVVLPQVVEECLLITEVEVVDEVVMDQSAMVFHWQDVQLFVDSLHPE